MKPSATLALSALLAVAAAVPLERRDAITSTTVVDVVETVEVYTTVWVQPGDPRLSQQDTIVSQPNSILAQATSTPPAAVTPPSSSSSSSSSTSSSSPAPPPPAQSSAPPAVVQPELKAAAPASAAAPAPAPAQSSPAPAPSPSTSTTNTNTELSLGGSCGDIGGQCVAANVTTFQGVIGDAAGACGWVDDRDTEDYFALASDTMGAQSNGNPFCGRKASITYNGQSFTGTVADKCPSTSTSCGGQSLDLSPSLFQKLFNADTGNFHDIKYTFTT